jgi:hypothetical protein
MKALQFFETSGTTQDDAAVSLSGRPEYPASLL